MAARLQKRVKRERPGRIRVPNRERVLLTVADQKFVGILQRLSLTGGSVIHTEEPFPQGTLAGLDLKTVFGKVTAQIEFLHTGADGIAAAQAFRFRGMEGSCTKRLRAAIEQMEGAGFSDVEIGQSGLARFVSQGLRKLRNHMQQLSGSGASPKKTRDRS
jgi:hypothetical protein